MGTDSEVQRRSFILTGLAAIPLLRTSTLTPEQWNQVAEQVQKYLNAIRARRQSANHSDPDLPTDSR
jgi:hypothetical protein